MILVFGATGYTGRLVAEQLSRGEDAYALGGRNRAGLEALGAELGALGGRSAASIRLADVADAESLVAMLEGVTAIINCVGPFEALGPPVVAAAARCGVPYCDVTGEPGFISHVARAYSEADAPLVPAAGFDYAPHSLAAALAASAVTDPVRIETGLWARDFVPTVGTQTSALTVLSGGGHAIENGQAVEVRTGALRRSFVFANGKRLAAVVYPGGDALQIHAHYPQAATVRSYAAVPLGVAWMAGAGFRMVRGLSRAGFVRRRFERLNATSNQGPAEDIRKRASFQVVAEAQGADGGLACALATGTDVYASTARISVALARRLQRFRELQLPTGFCAPAQVSGSPVAFARSCGLELSLQS